MDKNKLVTDYLAGTTAKDIARQQGLPYDQVLSTIKRAGIEVKRYVRPPSEQANEAIRLYESGMSAGEAAKAVGLTSSAVHAALRTAGKRARHAFTPKRFSEDEAKSIVEAYVVGESANSIGARLNRHPVVIAHLLKRKGVHIPNRTGGTPLRRLTDEEKAEIERQFAQGTRVPQIAESIGRLYTTVRAHLKIRGLFNWVPACDQHREEVLRLQGEGIGVREIARRLNTKETTVSYILAQEGLRDERKLVTHNESFWLTWTPVSAYWLGFLLADGCMTNRGGRTFLSLSLQAADEDHLRLFLSDLQCNAAISRHRKTMPSGKTFEQVSCKMGLAEEEASLLTRFGLVPRKTYTLDLSVLRDLPANLLRDALRGYVDGDGTVSPDSKGRRGHMEVSVAANGISAAFVSRIVFQKVGLSSSMSESRQAKDLWAIRWTGSKAALVARYLYEGVERSLVRKAEKARIVMDSWKSPKQAGPYRGHGPAVIS